MLSCHRPFSKTSCPNTTMLIDHTECKLFKIKTGLNVTLVLHHCIFGSFIYSTPQTLLGIKIEC